MSPALSSQMNKMAHLGNSIFLYRKIIKTLKNNKYAKGLATFIHLAH